MLSDISGPEVDEYLQILLGDNGSLVNGGDSNAERHFQVLIEGLIATRDTAELIEVIHIDHAGPPENPHPPVSLAVRVGVAWQVFYKIDAVGRMDKAVWPLLRSLDGQVKVTRIEGASTGRLLSLCDRAFQYVSRQLKDQKDTNSHLRGTIPELLAALLLVHEEYYPVRCSLKMDGIGELDATGYKEVSGRGQLKVIEAKKQSTTQFQLMSEIQQFADKIGKIRQNPARVETALGCPSSIQMTSGLFISMAAIGEFHEGYVVDDSVSEPGFSDSGQEATEFRAFLSKFTDIEFWDYNRFVTELERAGLPRLPVNLLEDVNLTWLLPGLNRGDHADIWQAFEDAIDNDNWQWPDSSDALQHRLDQLLAEDYP